MNNNKFKNPDSIFRPAPFWSWNDNLDSEELKRQIAQMAQKGWGGFFMHSRVGLVTSYLSDEWMRLVNVCIKAAQKNGIYAWLYDEDKWPSGFAGGEIPQMHEAYRSRALVMLEDSQMTDSDTGLKCIDFNGQTYVICKRVSSLDKPWFNGTCYVDLMNPEAVKAFLDSTHEKYKKACGEHFGGTVPGIFTDEPCYIFKNDFECPAIPWSEYLPDFFKNEKGYNLYDHIEELFIDTGSCHRTRFDFYDCATKLFIESFTKQYYNWCNENNLKMTGHFMAEDTLVSQTEWIGAAMPHYQYMHWPGIDKLGRHIEQLVTVKQLTSAADQLGRERSFSEVFGCVGQHVSFYHRKWIADWQAVLGVSFVNHHLSLYSMRGERKRDFPANLFCQQPWWEDEKPFSDYLGRLSYAVTQGTRDVDILVIHTIGSVWSEYSPLHKSIGMMKENELYGRPFDKLSRQLAAAKLDFHYGDEIIMQENAHVSNGKLVIGKCSYSTVVVPPCLTLRKETLRLLEEFQNQAGEDSVIVIGRMPERINGECCTKNLLTGAVFAETTEQAVTFINKRYAERIQVIDRMTGENAPGIFVQRRQLEDGELILFTNTDEKREVHAIITIPGADSFAVMDLMSGEEFIAPFTSSNGKTTLNAEFYPAGSLLLKSTGAQTDYEPSPEILDSGIRFEYKGSTESIAVISDWNLSFLENNVLPINDVTLFMDGKMAVDRAPVSTTWHSHFYKAEEGTPFRAEYRFHVNELPDGEMFAAVETAENADRITLNGHELRPLKLKGESGAFDNEKSWKDINFTRIILTGLVCEGMNTLTIEGKKSNNITGPGCHNRVSDPAHHRPTEIEAVYIVGDFRVLNYNNQDFSITARKADVCCRNLTMTGYPFYAGCISFEGSFHIDRIDKDASYFIRPEHVNAASVKIFVNGSMAAVKYWEPYECDVTAFLAAGKNEIRIVASTTLFNLMGPNRISGIRDLEYVSPHTFVDMKKHTDKYTLRDFGIGKCVLLKRN